MTRSSIEKKIAKLKREIEDIEAAQFEPYDDSLRAEKYALERKKDHLIRSIVLELHLAIEDLLTQLVIAKIIQPNDVKRRFSRSRIKPELWDLMEGNRALGFAAKVSLARSLRVLNHKQAEKLRILNTLRNSCSHNWQLNVVRRRNIRRHKTKPPLLRFQGKSLYDPKTFQQFTGDYGTLYLRLWLKVSAYS